MTERVKRAARYHIPMGPGDEERWARLIREAESPQSLDWLMAQLDFRDQMTPELETLILARQKALVGDDGFYS